MIMDMTIFNEMSRGTIQTCLSIGDFRLDEDGDFKSV